MQILGFNFEKITGEKKGNIQGKLEIASNIDVKDISQEKLELVKDQVALKMVFEFIVKYKPDVAGLSLHGAVLFMTDKDRAKEILKKWKAQKIEEDLKIALFNFIMTKCNLKALQIEEDLALPTHIPFPKLAPASQQQQKPYTG